MLYISGLPYLHIFLFFFFSFLFTDNYQFNKHKTLEHFQKILTNQYMGEFDNKNPKSAKQLCWTFCEAESWAQRCQ